VSKSLPWSKINDYLLELSSAGTKDNFLTSACAAVQGLLPYDNGCIFTFANGHIAVGIGYSKCQLRIYDDYYFERVPYMQKGIHPVNWIVSDYSQVDWNSFRHSEFVTDFARPNGLGRTLTSIAPGRRIFLNVNRSFSSTPFSAKEKSTLDLLSRHIDNLYSCFEKLDELSARAMPTPCEIRDRFPTLSKREAEVLSYLVRGLSAPEIASRLCIGVRTAESHIACAYYKLEVRSKGQAIRILESVAWHSN
jgi:DNA-binding CsgD family transcriptional regulator